MNLVSTDIGKVKQVFVKVPCRSWKPQRYREQEPMSEPVNEDVSVNKGVVDDTEGGDELEPFPEHIDSVSPLPNMKSLSEMTFLTVPQLDEEAAMFATQFVRCNWIHCGNRTAIPPVSLTNEPDPSRWPLVIYDGSTVCVRYHFCVNLDVWLAYVV